MPSESERLVVGFFHAMRAEAKRARRQPVKIQGPLPKPVYAHEWWALMPQQVRAAERIAAREAEREAEVGRRVDRAAEAYAWERQFG